MRSSESQINAYIDSLYKTLSKMSVLTFQLQSYTNSDKDAFRARNSSPLINGLQKINTYFEQKLQHKFTTLIEYNLEEFKKAISTGNPFIPKYSWNTMEDKKLSSQYSSSSVDITPVQEVPPKYTGPEVKVDRMILPSAPLADRIALNRDRV
jgi:hypothetical protein